MSRLRTISFGDRLDGPARMYQLQHYLDMMNDQHRMRPLDAAIRSVVRPGDVVLDLGAGTGVLTFIALDAGAAHVYAIERSPAIEVARRVARDNRLAHRITFIQSDARNVKPPRLVDGMIGDVRGTLPLLGDNIDLFEVVRERWLKQGGYTVPLADEIQLAPVSAAAPYRSIEGWKRPRREARYDVAAELAANGLLRTNLEFEELLADDQTVGSVHYYGKTPRKLELRTSFIITRTGGMNGLGLWFRGTLAPANTFDTSPKSPPTVYGQGFLPLAEPHPVVSGETIDVMVAVHRTVPEPTWTWSVASRTQISWQEKHSTFKGALLGLSMLDWLTGTKPPSLSDEGRMVRHVLAAIDGKATARELATGLVNAFPDRFASTDDALPAVTELLGRYGAS